MRSPGGALRATLQGALAIMCACRGPASAKNDGGSAALGPVTAVVIGVSPSLESIPYVVVKTEFRNSSSAPVTVRSYAITWPEGRFVASGVAMALAPGAVVTRTAQVGLDSGPIDLLTVGGSRVLVLDAR